MTAMHSAVLLLKRGVRRGLITLVREREYATTLGVLAGVAFLAQILVVSGAGVHGVSRLLESQLDLRLQIAENAADQKVQEMLVALRDAPMVKEVSYVTREQAYEREKARNPELTTFLEEFDIHNPFPDTIAVSLNSLSDFPAFETFVRQSAWETVVDPSFLTQTTGQEREVRQMLRLADAGQALAGAFLALITAVLLFVLIELVRRRAMMRREEILVERLFGAQEASVLVPFATEAAVLLFVALAVSAVLLGLLLLLLPIAVPALAPGGTLEPVRAETFALLGETMPGVLLLEFVLVPLLAFGGAFLALRPQMKSGRLALS